MNLTERKNAFIQLALVPFLVLNVIFPRNFSFKIDYSTLTDILKSESAVLGYTSFAVIPLQIVQDLFNKHNNPDQASKDDAGKKAPNPVSDLFSFSAEKTLKKSDCSDKVRQNSFGLCLKSIQTGFDDMFRRIDKHGGGGIEIFLLILICILTLPRGSIDDYVISFSVRSKNTARQIFSRVFFIFENKDLAWGYNAKN